MDFSTPQYKETLREKNIFFVLLILQKDWNKNRWETAKNNLGRFFGLFLVGVKKKKFPEYQFENYWDWCTMSYKQEGNYIIFFLFFFFGGGECINCGLIYRLWIELSFPGWAYKSWEYKKHNRFFFFSFFEMFGASMFDGASRSLVNSIKFLSGADILVEARHAGNPLDEEKLNEFLESHPQIVDDHTFVTYSFDRLWRFFFFYNKIKIFN